MIIVCTSEWFSEGMGYSENCLPRALAALGHEVHVVTSNCQIYFNSPDYANIYEKFLGAGIVDCGVKQIDGFILHRLPYYRFQNRIGVKGLFRKINEICPDIIQAFDIHSLTTLYLALYRPYFKYKLFLETHIHASVIRYPSSKLWKTYLRTVIQGFIIGKVISSNSIRCYPISSDAQKVAQDFYGIPSSKMKIVSLGVDTDKFYPEPVDKAESVGRKSLREKLGISKDEILAIYTGRLSEDKNPYCLAQAIGFIRKNNPVYRGLFIGDGPQSKAINSMDGCIVLPFMHAVNLAEYYRAADIGVWPKQESTSQLDAVCCGLPIIISDKTTVPERINGNGFTYSESDPLDLARKLLILENKELRRLMGLVGAKRISTQYSWNNLASCRVEDYQAALKKNR